MLIGQDRRITTTLHPTALISENANLGHNVKVGPFSIIEDGVSIDDNTIIGNCTTICSGTQIGSNSKIFHNCSIGEIPQDLKFAGEDTKTVIGKNTIIRENVTINRGTSAGGITVVGNNVLLMAAVHVAHDCIVRDNVIMANMSTLGGHVEIQEYASLGKNIRKFEKNIFIWAKNGNFLPAVAGNVSGGRMHHYVFSYQKTWLGTSRWSF